MSSEIVLRNVNKAKLLVEVCRAFMREGSASSLLRWARRGLKEHLEYLQTNPDPENLRTTLEERNHVRQCIEEITTLIDTWDKREEKRLYG
jgi:hypothetical protein